MRTQYHAREGGFCDTGRIQRFLVWGLDLTFLQEVEESLYTSPVTESALHVVLSTLCFFLVK